MLYSNSELGIAIHLYVLAEILSSNATFLTNHSIDMIHRRAYYKDS